MWGAQTSPPSFGLFAIFDRNFVKIVASLSDENKNSSASEKTIISEKGEKNQNRSINRDTIPVQIISPSNERPAGLKA